MRRTGRAGGTRHTRAGQGSNPGQGGQLGWPGGGDRGRSRPVCEGRRGRDLLLLPGGAAQRWPARPAATARVSLAGTAGSVCFEVTDDGPGFDPAAVRGSGLQNKTDRLAALGGTISVSTRPGAGTTAHGRVPLTPLTPTPSPNPAERLFPPPRIDIGSEWASFRDHLPVMWHPSGSNVAAGGLVQPVSRAWAARGRRDRPVRAGTSSAPRRNDRAGNPAARRA